MLSGQAVAPNTTVFSGDKLQVQEGVAVVAMGQGSRMVFGHETAASFLRDANDVTVLLGRGNVSLYHPAEGEGLRVKVAGVTVEPAKGYKTLGEVAMLNGAVVVTAKQGMLQVEGQGRTEQVGEGKTITMPVSPSTARAPMPNPASGGSDAHITEASALEWLTFASAATAAVLAGLDLSRTGDDKALDQQQLNAANAATAAANAAGAAANAAGCAVDAANPNTSPSPYIPPSGFTCP